MNDLSQMLLVLQIALAVAAITLFLLSRHTSRADTLHHEAYLPIAVIVACIASLGAAIAVYDAGAYDNASYLLALLPVTVTATLCVKVIWRAVVAGIIGPRRHRPSA